MPLTPAEKQKLYRERRDADPVRRQRYLEAERQKYLNDKATGKKKMINSCTPREKRHRRRQWRSAQTTHRNKLKSQKTYETVLEKQDEKKTSKRKKQRKLSKQVKVLQGKLKQQVKLAEKYRKRLQRLGTSVMTPKQKASQIIKNTMKLRKAVLFHSAMVSDLRLKYAETKDQREKQVYCNLFSGALIKKYKLRTYAAEHIGFHYRKFKDKSNTLQTRSTKSKKLGPLITEFYTRDDNSRVLPGKKQTVTLRKNKKQKRILLDSLKNLHQKYLAENQHKQISYSLFCKMKPFWIKIPTEADRDTCICKVHSNIEMLTKTLHHLQLKEADNPENLVKSMVCSMDDINCMYEMQRQTAGNKTVQSR